jgi:hypothetical protein
MNHNELEGMEQAALFKSLVPVIIQSAADDAHVQRRMQIFQELASECGRQVIACTLHGETPEARLLELWCIVRKAAHELAEEYDVPAEDVPLIEAFKKRLA